jgi:hypothetical protein
VNKELEAKILQRTDEMLAAEASQASLDAERHRREVTVEAEHEVTVEAENAAISRWAAPVAGTYVEKCNETARAAEKARDTTGQDTAER